ncbi:MAG: hypothetical protein AAGD92_15595 [Pseudomonadota bacterium]
MFGSNGIANIIAALIVAGAIIWTGGFGGGKASNAPAGEDAYTEWLTRAVGDIRNDIVVNCGCCGEGGEEGQRRAAARSF